MFFSKSSEKIVGVAFSADYFYSDLLQLDQKKSELFFRHAISFFRHAENCHPQRFYSKD
jgi:sRNA-binding regulator protein Hfq